MLPVLPPLVRNRPSVRPFVSGGVWRMMFLVPALAAHAPALIPALPFPLPRIYRGHLEPANFQLSPVFVRDSELWASKIFHIFLEGRTEASLFKKVLSARSQPAWFCDAICFHSVTIHSSPSSSALLLTPELRLIYPVGPSVSSAFPRLSPFEALQTAAACVPASCCSTNEILRDFHYDRRDALRDESGRAGSAITHSDMMKFSASVSMRHDLRHPLLMMGAHSSGKLSKGPKTSGESSFNNATS